MSLESDIFSPQPDSLSAQIFAKPSGILRRGADYLATALKGAVGVPEAAVGIADIFTGGQAGKLAEDIGFRPKEAKSIIDEWYSPEQKEANKAVQEAKGFFPTLAAAVQKPSTIAHSVVESLPSILAGGAIARGAALIPKVSPVLASAIGEGAVSAGQTAEQIRQESKDGTLTPSQAAISAGSGALTGALTGVGGAVAKRLGISDIDTLVAGGKAASGSGKSLGRRAAEGFVSEGILEELPQSAQEQIAQNLAQGKPWDEGVGNAAAMGTLAGGVMGVGGGLIHGRPVAAEKGGEAPPGQKPIDEVPLPEIQRDTMLPNDGPQMPTPKVPGKDTGGRFPDLFETPQQTGPEIESPPQRGDFPPLNAEGRQQDRPLPDLHESPEEADRLAQTIARLDASGRSYDLNTAMQHAMSARDNGTDLRVVPTESGKFTLLPVKWLSETRQNAYADLQPPAREKRRPEPAAMLALPGPDTPIPGQFIANPDGTVRPATAGDRMGAVERERQTQIEQQARQAAAIDSGLTADVQRAVAARANTVHAINVQTGHTIAIDKTAGPLSAAAAIAVHDGASATHATPQTILANPEITLPPATEQAQPPATRPTAANKEDMSHGKSQKAGQAAQEVLTPEKAPVSPQSAPSEDRAYTQAIAQRTAKRLTAQGLPSVAVPHPTRAGLWAVTQGTDRAQESPGPSNAKKERKTEEAGKPTQQPGMEENEKAMRAADKALRSFAGGTFEKFKESTMAWIGKGHGPHVTAYAKKHAGIDWKKMVASGTPQVDVQDIALRAVFDHVSKAKQEAERKPEKKESLQSQEGSERKGQETSKGETKPADPETKPDAVVTPTKTAETDGATASDLEMDKARLRELQDQIDKMPKTIKKTGLTVRKASGPEMISGVKSDSYQVVETTTGNPVGHSYRTYNEAKYAADNFDTVNLERIELEREMMQVALRIGSKIESKTAETKPPEPKTKPAEPEDETPPPKTDTTPGASEKPRAQSAKPAKTDTTATEEDEKALAAIPVQFHDQARLIAKLVSIDRMDDSPPIGLKAIAQGVARTKEGEDLAALFKSTVNNQTKAAKKRLLGSADLAFRDAFGKGATDQQVMKVIKTGILDISAKPWARDFYEMFKIDAAKIAKPIEKASDAVGSQLEKFNAGVFDSPKPVTAQPGKNGVRDQIIASQAEAERVYAEAARQFLEGELTASVPTAKSAMLDPAGLENLRVRPIQRAVKPVKTYADQIKALLNIAGDQDIRYYLNGIHVEGKRMVAADGSRLAVLDDADMSGVPPKSEQYKDATVINRYFGTKHGSGETDPSKQWIVGRFPDWNRALPREQDRLRVGTFDAARVGDVSRGVVKAFRYITHSKHQSVQKVEIDGVRVPVNARYLADAADLFRAFGYPSFDIRASDPNDGLLLTSPDGRLKQVIMPVRGVEKTLYLPIVPDSDVGKQDRSIENKADEKQTEPDSLDVRATTLANHSVPQDQIDKALAEARGGDESLLADLERINDVDLNQDSTKSLKTVPDKRLETIPAAESTETSTPPTTPAPSREAEDADEQRKRENPNVKATVADHRETMGRLREGTATLAEYKAAFSRLSASESEIKEELSGKTKDALLKLGGSQFAYRYKSDAKDRVISALYDDMLSDFAIGRSISYVFGEKGGHRGAISRMVDSTNEETLKEYANKVAAARADRIQAGEKAKAAIADPKTIEDFNTYIRFKKSEGMSFTEARMSLTPEQRAKYDELLGEESRNQRKARSDQQKTDVRAASVTAEGQVVETKHTKTGAPLFVVKAADRVEREVYNQWNATAKRLGGWYSSFRGAGAVPGFQFKTRENADAFLAYLGGKVEQAKTVAQERRDAFADDKSQSAVERLNEMADRLDEKGDDSLSVERKANTARRARFAAAAENAAHQEKALATTMRNIAKGISAGSVKFLDRVRTKAQVEMLREMLSVAKGNELRANYKNYVDEEKHRGEEPTAETADYADFPSYTAFRSDLATLGRHLAEIDGTKKLGAQLLKVAGDVSAAYREFAKKNMLNVSGFSTQDGKPAIFTTADDADAAIARSGFKGKAIAFQVKRGQYAIIKSPEAAREAGIWPGDDDKRITLTAEFGDELVDKLARQGRRNGPEAPWQFVAARDKRKRLASIGIETPAEFRAALREFASLREAPNRPSRIKELERSMIGRAKDGLDFFPTPQVVADAMVDAAGIEPGMSVLEPSAGWGHIAELIRESGVDPDVIEMSNSRAELLDAKGFNVIGRDFMDLTPRSFTYGDVFRDKGGNLGVMRGSGGLGSGRVGFDPLDGGARKWVNRDDLEGVEKRGGNSGYDRIVMNPPFSDRRDAEHVMHAYSLLRPGGRLVAIMGEGVFFGQDKKAQGFREWLESVNGTSEKLPEGSFQDPSLPANTSVNARMVVIEKGDEVLGSMADQGAFDATNPDILASASGISAATRSDGLLLSLISQGKSTDEILGAIAKSSRNPFYRLLATRLKSIGLTSTISMGTTEGTRFTVGGIANDKFAASYRPKTDRVTIHKPNNLERNLLHELMHAATYKAVRGNGIAASQMKALFEHVKSDGRLNNLYGMSNVDEFIAEAFSNPQFQSVLRLVDAPKSGGKIKSAWDWFVNLVRRAVGLPVSQHDALSESLSIGGRLMNGTPGQSIGVHAIGNVAEDAREKADRELADLAKSMRYARGSDQAMALRKEVVGKPPFENIESGIKATISGGTFGKMMSKSALDRSVSPAAHFQALVNLDKLFRLATLEETRKGNKLDDDIAIDAIHHFDVPMPFDGDVLKVRIMVKALRRTDQGNRIYLVQALEIGTPASERGDSTVPADRTRLPHPPAGVDGRFAQMVAAVKRGIDGGDDVLGNLADASDLRTRATNAASDLLTSAQSFNWLNRTINTQYHKAQKDPEHFGRVFDLGQRFIETISRTASRPADLAPNLLPKLENARAALKGLLGRTKTDAILNGLASAVFSDDLRDPNAHVWSDGELREKFRLTDEQIGLYREFRRSVDASLDEVAAAEAWKSIRRYVPMAQRETAKERVLSAPGESRSALHAIVDQAIQAEPSEEIRATISGQHQFIDDTFDRAGDLKRAGYAPRMRFGRYTVTALDLDSNGKPATDKPGEPKPPRYFGMFESEREANAMARRLRSTFGTEPVSVVSGVASEQQFKLYRGISPETVGMFADVLAKHSNPEQRDQLRKTYDAWRALAFNNRSTIKRMIERKGIAGFGEDVPRVLASFLTSNARRAASAYHADDIAESVDSIPKEKGDVKDEAIRLSDAVLNPEGRAPGVRNFLFFQYLGGSLAAAAVNMTQPVMMTLPYLAQHVGARKATSLLAGAARQMFKVENKELAAALRQASQEGIVEPQEIHYLYSQSIRGGMISKLPGAMAHRAQAFLKLWGTPFAVAESINRRMTFIAAWNAAIDLGEANQFAFAKRAVEETQGVYNAGNANNLSRTALGSVAMTFRQYSIAYLEMLTRMWKSGPEGKKAAVLALAIMALAGGAGGLPFADDLDDLIDTLGQAFGYDTNAKRWKEKMAADVLGKEVSPLVLHGLSPYLPIDIQGRLGMGNLLPATSVLKKSENSKDAQLLEILGPAGGVAQSYLQGAEAALSGDYLKALRAAIMPKAIKDIAQGADMMATGMYRDTKGRKVIDTDAGDAVAKMIGFQPSEVADVQRDTRIQQQDIALWRKTAAEITDQRAQAIIEKDPDLATQANRQLQRWNADNPGMPIVIKASAITSKVKAAMLSKEERIVKTAPPAMRARVFNELQR